MYIRIVHVSLLCLLLIGCSRPTDNSQAPTVDQLTLRDLRGAEIDLRQYEGKFVFLNLWATWCAPCIREMPSIDHASQLLRDENIVFLLASDESIDRIQKFAEGKGFTVPLVQIEDLSPLNVQALPTTIILDGEGAIVHSEVGFRLWDSPESIEMIRNIMKGRQP